MAQVSIGEPVYDGQGELVGEVRGLEESGVYVSVDGFDPAQVDHETVIKELGEGELVWRCGSCGEVGRIDEMPDGCPSCDAPKTELYYWTED